MSEEYRNFGHQKVEASLHQKLVAEVFDSVSGKYDLMNDVMSLGAHRLWKRRFCTEVTNLDAKILDVAAGSGDISLKLIELALAQGKNPKITMADINQNMLDVAKRRAQDKNFFKYLDFALANAENLPFEVDNFDYYSISFGIRNVTNKEAALKEAFRVLKRGGKFICMEFSNPKKQSAKKRIYDFYLTNIVPQMGRIFARERGAYQYLSESIDSFLPPDEFASMLESAGFVNVRFTKLVPGIVWIFTAYKP